ncbi:tail fiber domain-containing protein [Flavobacterium sp. J27]|uniref:tail fiber domain-containing protein n=1 Tax=Flavobacterium sp. J27 TaxID=2060419 RepID=UPI00102FBA20|nr:tail fiber domain-containing protein [Flavobacterium sp. J27]
MMKKIGCFIFLFSVFNFVTAQVGVNTTSPKASLDIQINDAANPTNEDGILIPRIDTFPSSNPTADQNAMLVYLTTAVGTNNPGFYYWDNVTTTWIGLQKAGAISKIIDTDLDTKIDVEETADEDIIRFTSAGVNGLNIVDNRIETTDAIGHTIKIGFEAGLNDDSNFRRNVFVGYRSGKYNTTGLGNNVIGFGALESNTTGTGNSALGYLTMNKNTIGKDNTAVGNRSLYNNTTGNHNLALGYGALISNTTSNANIALGSFGLSALNSGSVNISIGYQTLESLVTGNNNIAIGSNAGRLNTTGSNNTLLGHEAGKNATSASNNVLIGYQAGLSEMGNNKLYIENSGSATPLIYGEFDTNLLRVNGILDINNAYQLPTTDGTTGQALVTDGAGAVTWTNVNSDTTKIIDTDLDTQIQVEESPDEDKIRFDIAGSEVAVITSRERGSIGVVTDDPRSTIHISDGSTSSKTVSDLGGYGTALQITDVAIPRIYFEATAQGLNKKLMDLSYYTQKLRFSSLIDDGSAFDKENILVIERDGNVGVGTGNPQEKFHVLGKIRMADGTQQAGYVMTSDANGTASWSLPVKQNNIIDADLDTKIQVEETADDDTIRFDISGTEYFTMKNGRINVLNTGKSVFIGENAGLNDDLSNNSNIALGGNAFLNGTTGSNNIAIGNNTLSKNNSDSNIAIGTEAIRENTSGIYNLALGYNTLLTNTTGTRNVIIGSFALKDNMTGSNNTVLGFNAGRTATGSNNVFLGNAAGLNETGNHKLYIENSSSATPLIYGEFDNDLLRINGTLDINNAYQFPTTDGTTGQALVTDGAGAVTWTNVNSETTKIIDADLDTKIEVETSADEDIIRFSTEGTEFFNMKNGKLNVINTGESVFIGENAGLNDDLSTNYNVAIGRNALYTSTIGYHNTAIGLHALYSNNEYGNTAVGNYSLKNNTTGYNNAAFGFNAFTANVSGRNNLALGAYAMYTNSSGTNNVAIGMNAGRNSTGDGNVFIGISSGNNETGNNKLYIENSGSSAPLIYGEFDTDYLQVNGNFDVGVSGDGTIARANAWNTFSDRRWKTNFKKIENALDKLNQINGYYYNWKDKKDQSLQVGVIAQEIEAVLPEIVSTDKNGYKSVDYSKISALLIQVTKEQQGVIEKQEIKIEELSKKYTDLAKEIENMKQLLSSTKE